MYELDQEERKTLESFDRGQWQSDVTPERLRQLQTYGQATLAKNKRITIRISSRDLEELQVKALQEGIPYQTLITSILHKYVSGQLVEGS